MGRIIEKDVEERLIKVYINVGFISYLIEVKKLVSRGSNSSFSVDVSSDDMYKTIINVEFWPNTHTLHWYIKIFEALSHH